jgi:cytochrome c-type biogenesis protein CcmF
VLNVHRKGKEVGLLYPERGYYPSSDEAGLGAIGRFFEGDATSEVGLKAGLRRDFWTAMRPDVDAMLPIIRQGDKVFGAAEGKLPAGMEGPLLAQALRGIVRQYVAHPPPATFRAISSPLVSWIWLGAIVVFGGGLLALWPAPDAARRRESARYAARVGRDVRPPVSA